MFSGNSTFSLLFYDNFGIFWSLSFTLLELIIHNLIQLASNREKMHAERWQTLHLLYARLTQYNFLVRL